MKLETIFIAAATLLVAGLLLLPQPADARRMGGGGNVGKQYSMPSQAPAQRPTQAQGPTATAGQRAPQAGGASRWLGPLAGLAAGGLLASMFMGGGFQGFQIMDFLVVAALGFGVFMLWRWFRRNQARTLAAAAYGRTATANAGPGFNAPPAGPDPLGAQNGGGLGEARGSTGGGNEFPVWFDGAAFEAGAKDHYIRLQAAWDKADFSEIRDYTTPELCAELQRERAALAGPQYTEVVRLQAQLASLQRDGDLAVASILFSGLIREDEQGPAQEVREFWHVQHQWASAAGDWYIAGIQQA
ncbi:TIM44-like domain-containing protein [uncultured Thiodictyon sp.]|jgi:predicted lipid-binding transport protein (Tim44 family)|uniref:Tim44 domain-containing protein n=1 Tax=uncultured Thiodictyon sp. TaxID=1846217 RepID=UPI0025D2718D|nr:TIM44-like domain-containing protein [uncultured Thiodictyon sp.]